MDTRSLGRQLSLEYLTRRSSHSDIYWENIREIHSVIDQFHGTKVDLDIPDIDNAEDLIKFSVFAFDLTNLCVCRGGEIKVNFLTEEGVKHYLGPKDIEIVMSTALRERLGVEQGSVSANLGTIIRSDEAAQTLFDEVLPLVES